jgi:hypothetical protein
MPQATAWVGLSLESYWTAPPLTVFCLRLPPNITANVKTDSNPTGTLPNSDLELAGFVLMWIMMEKVCNTLTGRRVAIFCNKSPRVVGATNDMLLKPHLGENHPSPCIAFHHPKSESHHNAPYCKQPKCNDCHIAQSFGSKPKWHFNWEEDYLTFFNSKYPLPSQNLWTVCLLISAIATCMIFVLQMMPFNLDK